MPSPARRTRFTDTAVRAIRPPTAGQVAYWDTTLPCFGLRVAAGGSKTWIVQYRAASRVRRLKLGRYPLLGVADARARAKEALASVTQGNDPAGTRREERDAATFEQLARDYLELYAKGPQASEGGQPRKRSWREDERILNRDVIPAWRTRRARDITAQDVRTVLDGIVARGAPIQANRTLAIVRRVFNWAAAPDRAYVPQFFNPCRGLTPPAKERARERVLSPTELRAVWAAIESEDLGTAALFKLYLLTVQRGGELRRMAWGDVDLEGAWWTIPPSHSKNGLSHRVPLSPPAVTLLRQMLVLADGSPWVFPTTRRSASGYRERVYKAVDRLQKASQVFDFTPHDLRRTVASGMASLGIDRLTVKRLLNHVERDVTAVYIRHTYDAEKRVAVDAWAGHLASVVSAR